jgi:hypothetical protein
MGCRYQVCRVHQSHSPASRSLSCQAMPKSTE